MIRGQTHVSLLLSVRADESVDAHKIDVVHALDSSSDLTLVGEQVDDEGESVVVLNLLHGRLSAQRKPDDTVLVHLVPVGGALALVLGVTRKRQSFGPPEMHGSADLQSLLGISALLDGLGGSLGLLHGGLSGLGSL